MRTQTRTTQQTIANKQTHNKQQAAGNNEPQTCIQAPQPSTTLWHSDVCNAMPCHALSTVSTASSVHACRKIQRTGRGGRTRNSRLTQPRPGPSPGAVSLGIFEIRSYDIAYQMIEDNVHPMQAQHMNKMYATRRALRMGRCGQTRGSRPPPPPPDTPPGT